ncbi:MAG: hypothetical protein IPM82_19845 [Saprospiraceae bacterium]|nr:hypothetical protein [Saprospiraceae bacterium]
MKAKGVWGRRSRPQDALPRRAAEEPVPLFGTAKRGSLSGSGLEIPNGLSNPCFPHF